MSTIYLTQEGYDNLKSELVKLISIERPKIINQIAEARDKGDLSENAEYDAAKEAQGLLEARISKLENDLSNARVLDETQTDTSTVHLLTKVTILNIDNNLKMTYSIVSETEADLAAKKISVTSPIGKGLLGKSVGEIAEIQVPNGVACFKILDISSL
ncbi:MAG: transcription elongation factor GreA [Flavobacteriales bacterium]|nr:transcription elongation factor GreA [Flavobacteriales bacterium]